MPRAHQESKPRRPGPTMSARAPLLELGRLAADLAQPEDVTGALAQPLSLNQLQQALSHEGNLERLRCFMRKLADGANVTLAAVGGSITAGGSSSVARDLSGTYHMKIYRWLQRRYPQAHIRHATAAIPSVFHEDYMEHCLSMHVPQSADLVLLDTPANLCDKCVEGHCNTCNVALSAIELMLRTLLDLPRRPAVVFVNFFMFWDLHGPKAWKRSDTGKGLRLKTAMNLSFHRQFGHGRHEHMLDELAKYYAAPSVSLRDVIFHDVQTTSHFNGVHVRSLYHDQIHPSARGQTIMAQATLHLLKRAALLSAVHPPSRCGLEAPQLPQPMLADRTRQRMLCLNAHSLRKLPGDCSWAISIADSRRGKGAGMHYLSGDREGDSCQVGLAVLPEDGSGQTSARYVGIAYKASMKSEMGLARVECPARNCACEPLELDARASKLSLQHVTLAPLMVNMTRGAARCDLRFTVLRSKNASGSHFSLAALYVNPYSARWWFGEWLMRRALSSLSQARSADEALLGRQFAVGWEDAP